MKTNLNTHEITLILKSMFIMLSNDFQIHDERIHFLNEVAVMSTEFQLIEFKEQIENWKNEYNSQPEYLLKNFLDELKKANIDTHTKQLLLSFAGGILEQSEKTYHRLVILKCIRAQLNLVQKEIPEDYKQYQEINLPINIIREFLERQIINTSTLFKISNEHNELAD